MAYLKSKVWKIIQLAILNKKWEKMQNGCDTWFENYTDIEKVKIGKNTYGPLTIYNDTQSNLIIGNYCSIADDVVFLLGIEHNTKLISSFPFKGRLCKKYEAISKGNIIVDDDVWIGYGATILSGVHIGQGAVIAAGAVVSHDVPPYAIVGGVPAKVIKYRFSPELIEELLKVDYGKLSKEDIEKHIDELYVELKDVRQLDWMPKKEDKEDRKEEK